jgi:membrane-bound lytic murein transglycosylase D
MKKSNFRTMVIKKLMIGFVALTANTSIIIAQDITNSKKVLLADIGTETKTTVSYEVKDANIVFPSVLQGNEAQSVEYIESFAKKRRDYLLRMYKKSRKYFPKIATVLRRYRLPQEYQVLIALESAFNGNAVSGAGAVGYWQIMDEVAKEYGLVYEPQLSQAEKKKLQEEVLKNALSAKLDSSIKVKKVVVQDDRKNFIKSTNTAARYLRDRTRNLNSDVLMIVASYNCGVGNVWEAKRKTGLSNPTFWDIKKYLPAETQSYVMNFITMNVIFNNIKKFESNTLTYKPVEVKVITKEKMQEEVIENSAVEY